MRLRSFQESMVRPAATCSISESVWVNGLATKIRKAKICSPDFGPDVNWQVWLNSYTPSDLIDVEADPDGGTVN